MEIIDIQSRYDALQDSRDIDTKCNDCGAAQSAVWHENFGTTTVMALYCDYCDAANLLQRPHIVTRQGETYRPDMLIFPDMPGDIFQVKERGRITTAFAPADAWRK